MYTYLFKGLHIVFFIHSLFLELIFYSYSDVPSLIAKTSETKAKIKATKI